MQARISLHDLANFLEDVVTNDEVLHVAIDRVEPFFPSTKLLVVCHCFSLYVPEVSSFGTRLTPSQAGPIVGNRPALSVCLSL